MLASWGGPLPERIDRLFRLSGRMSDSWDARYGDRTYGPAHHRVGPPRVRTGRPERPLCRKLELFCGDAVTSRPIEWLWPVAGAACSPCSMATSAWASRPSRWTS
jgi:hypothetical protein